MRVISIGRIQKTNGLLCLHYFSIRPLLALFSFLVLFSKLYAQDAKFVVPIISSLGFDEIRIAPDNKNIITISNNLAEDTYKYQSWDAVNTSYVKTISSGTISDCKSLLSSDGKYMLLYGSTYGYEPNVECWDIAENKIVWAKKNQFYPPSCSVFGDKVIISGESYGKQKDPVVYKLSTGDSVGVVSTLGANVKSCLFSPNGKYLMIDSRRDIGQKEKKPGDSVSVYSVGQNVQAYGIIIKGKINEIVFSADSKNMLVKTDSAVHVFDVETGKLLLEKEFPVILDFCKMGSQSGKIYTGFYAYPGITDGYYLTSWKILSGECIDLLKLPIRSGPADIRADESEIAFTSDDSVLRYSFVSGKMLPVFKRQSSVSRVWDGIYTPDGGKYIAGLENGSLEVFNTSDASPAGTGYGVQTAMVKVRFTNDDSFVTWDDHSLQHDFEAAMENLSGYYFIDVAKKWSVTTAIQDNRAYDRGLSENRISVSRSGKYLVTISKSGFASIWNANTKARISKFKFDQNFEYSDFKFSSDDQRFAYTTMAKEHSNHLYYLQVRDLESCRLISSIRIPDGGEVLGATRHLDYVVLSSYSSDDDWKIWDIRNKKILYKSGKQQVQLRYYHFNDDREFFMDGGRAFAAFKKKTLYICHFLPVKGLGINEPIKIGRDSMDLTDVQVSKNEKFLAARKDSIIYVWQASDGKFIDSLNMHLQIDQYQFYNESNSLIAVASTGNQLIVGKWDFLKKQSKIVKQNLKVLPGERGSLVNSMDVSANGKLALIAMSNVNIACYDIAKNTIRYSLVPLSFGDKFCYDPDGRYDGSKSALNSIYFRCGMKAIKYYPRVLNGYEPGLVSKIMKVNHPPLKAKRLEELGICQ